MTEYENDLLICQYTNDIAEKLRLTKADKVSDYDSFQSRIAESTKTPGKSWIATMEYQAGDIVTSGTGLYIAKRANTNKIPNQNTKDWQSIIQDYYNNAGKIKAFAMFSYDPHAAQGSELALINGYNVSSVTAGSNVDEYGVNHNYFTINFQNALSYVPTVVASLPEMEDITLIDPTYKYPWLQPRIYLDQSVSYMRVEYTVHNFLNGDPFLSQMYSFAYSDTDYAKTYYCVAAYDRNLSLYV